MQITAYHQTLPASNGEAPEWIQLLPAGTWHGVDGRGPYRTADAAALIAASMQSGKLPIDENHATDYAMKSGQPSPACGWIVEMQSRADGIWGRVDWTPSGKQMMSEQAYKGISPVFRHDAKGNVGRILRAALTNTPNCVALATLHSQRDGQMDLAQLRQALSLADGAGEAEVLAAIGGFKTTATAHAQLVVDAASAAGVTATDGTQLVTALATQKATVMQTGDLAGKVIALQTELSALQASGARTAATAVVDKAITEGKPILPLRDHFIARHAADPAGVEKELAALPSIHTGGVAVQARQPEGDDEAPLTNEDLAACKKMGIDPKDMAKNKRKQQKEAA